MQASRSRSASRSVRFASRALALALATAGLTLAGTADTWAQTLDRSMCPAGSPFNLRPMFAPFAPGSPGFPMLRKTIDTALHPDALCNDGSPAVMYVRPGNHDPQEPVATKWLIFFDGGGGCRDEDTCLLERWCSLSGRIFDRAGKMSSKGAFEAIRSPGGIFDLTPGGGLVNHFASYNHVLIHYCNSSQWIGSASKVGLTTSTGVTYDMEIQGEATVNAVIETLLSGPTTPDPSPVRDLFPYKLPDLDNATEIVFAGDSAGAGGLRNHIDRLYDWLHPLTGADIRAVFDADFVPWKGDSGIIWTGSPVADYADFLVSVTEPIVRSFWEADDSALDASCLDPLYAADHVAAGGVHPQICYDTGYTALNHITTPSFQRADINDPLQSEPYVAWHLYPLPDDYWLAIHDQFATFGTYSPAGGGLEAPLGQTGVQAPHCRKHVAIKANEGFFRDHVSGPTYPVPLSFHDLVVNWINGVPAGNDKVQIQEDNLGPGAYSASVCF
jgi:hypothetical protein